MADDTATQAPEVETSEPQQNAETPKPTPVEAPPEVKAALRKANKEAETLRLKLQEYEDRDKTEAQRLAERAEQAEARAVELETRALRLEVAHEKGLTPAQAKRLVGSTREELEADADELLETFKAREPEVPSLDLGSRTTGLAPAKDPKSRDLAQIEADLAAATKRR